MSAQCQKCTFQIRVFSWGPAPSVIGQFSLVQLKCINWWFVMSSLKLIWHHHALYSLQSWHQIAPDSQFPLNHYKYHYQCNSATLYWYPINSSHHTGSVPTSKPAVMLGLWCNNYRATKGQLLVSILAAFPSLFFTNRPSRLVRPNP